MTVNATHVARSGFRHIRLCNDCKQEITTEGACACASESPWRIDMAVTICADAAGERPTGFATIGRFGNGAFRLKGTKHWISIATGASVHGGVGYARQRRDGDDALVAVADAEHARRLAWASDLKRLVTKRDAALAGAAASRDYLTRIVSERLDYERRIVSIQTNVKQCQRREAENVGRIEANEAEARELDEQIAALKAGTKLEGT